MAANPEFRNKNLKDWPNFPPNTTDIRIENNQLTSIPPSISDLKSLTRIIASNNQIKTISNKITELVNFIDLRLINNKLEDIPETVFSLQKLSILILNENQIKTVPKSVNGLKNLTQIHLQNNVITSLPKEIGELKNLTHLLLDNNPLEYLPPSIKNLSKLALLSLNGTKLPLPPNYIPNQNIPATIDYILENQKAPLPELNIKKAYVFNNFSKPSLIENIESVQKEYFKEIEVDFENITSVENIDSSTTVILIVIGFDVHDNQELVFDIINKCKEVEVPYKILFQKDIKSIEEVHVEKGVEFQLLRSKFQTNFKQEINGFNSDDELKGLILNVLKQHSPEVELKSLELINIGHFDNTIISFDDKLTCLIGENGQGKSSILRALSLAIVGVERNGLDQENSLKNLLQIKSISKDNKTIYQENGKINLKYTLDSHDYYNEITFTSKDEGRLIEIKQSGDFEINSGDYHLKTLIVGFPQLRGKIQHKDKEVKYSQPHINDLIPLALNNDDTRLNSFLSWITNLYGEAIKNPNPDKTREYGIINYVFKLISELTGKQMNFSSVQSFSPPIVIVKSPDSPNGVPLNLISQGFKIVIGWIGYFIERKIEAYPLSSPENSVKEKSILIIDEIDSSIHPVWQARLLSVLRDQFPNTQIICTTHSPLMVAGLNREQILEIENIEGNISVNQSPFDTWSTSYKEILKHIFDTKEFVPVKTRKELELLIEENIDNPEKVDEINESIERINENEMLVDKVCELENRLQQRELELESLIEEYSKKNSK